MSLTCFFKRLLTQNEDLFMQQEWQMKTLQKYDNERPDMLTLQEATGSSLQCSASALIQHR